MKLSTQKPRRTGYTFLGWSTSSTATTATYSPGDTYTNNGRVTLYAVWSAKTYTISYNANGGSGAPDSQTKYHGVKLMIPSIEPTKSGYTFLGWGVSKTSTSPTYQPGEWYYSNISRTLYAVWQKNAPTSYTVSYDANGGSGAPSSQTKTKDVTLTLSSTKPTRSGYTFLGWATSASATSASYQPGGSYTANASVTLYAVWSCNHASTKTVWDTGCKWRKVCNNCGVTVSSGTTHGPYTYGDWVYYSGSQHRRTQTCNHGDYSGYEYASHSGSTMCEKYSATQHKKYSYCSDCSSSYGTISYEDHTFSTFSSNGQTVSTCSQCGYTKTTAQTYTVSYNANGGSNAPASQTKVHGVTLTLSSTVPYRFNYEFLGWSASSSATTATYVSVIACVRRFLDGSFNRGQPAFRQICECRKLLCSRHCGLVNRTVVFFFFCFDFSVSFSIQRPVCLAPIFTIFKHAGLPPSILSFEYVFPSSCHLFYLQHYDNELTTNFCQMSQSNSTCYIFIPDRI